MLDFPTSPTAGQVFRKDANAPTKHIFDGGGWRKMDAPGEITLIDAGTTTAIAVYFKLEPEFTSFRAHLTNVVTPTAGMLGILYSFDNGVTFPVAIGTYWSYIMYQIGVAAPVRIVSDPAGDSSRLIYCTGTGANGVLNNLTIDVARGVGPTGYPCVLWQIDGHAAMEGMGLCGAAGPLTHIAVVNQTNPFTGHTSFTCDWQWWGY